jgi:hypothetical protein
MIRGQEIPLRTLPVEPTHEWLSLVEHWRQQPDTPVWFLAEAGRHDLALIDPRSRRLIRTYQWSFARKFLMSRVPATGLDWYEMRPPGWIAAEGWSLSPEVAGVAHRDDREPGQHPIVAFVRRRGDAAVLVVGGRNVSGPDGPAAQVHLSVGGRRIESWPVLPDGVPFLRLIQLPEGALAGSVPYLPLEIRTTPLGGDISALRVLIEQFDLQSADSVVYGFDSGWYPQAFDGAAPSPWRWSGPRADLRVHSAGKDLTLRIVGEAPLEHLGGLPRLEVQAGDESLARLLLETRNVDVQIAVPARALDRSGGVLTFALDRSFVPDVVLGNGDRRRLGLRVYRLDLTEVTPGVASLPRSPR